MYIYNRRCIYVRYSTSRSEQEKRCLRWHGVYSSRDNRAPVTLPYARVCIYIYTCLASFFFHRNKHQANHCATNAEREPLMAPTLSILNTFSIIHIQYKIINIFQVHDKMAMFKRAVW